MSKPATEPAPAAAHAVTVAPRRSSQVEADTRPIVMTAVAFTGLLAVASFAAGVPGLYAMGQLALLPGVMPALVPVLLDGGLVVFSLSALVLRGRNQGNKFPWTAVAVLTAASMALQAAHVVLDAATITAETYVGAGLAASFPAIVFAATHALQTLAIADAPKRKIRPGRRKKGVPVGSTGKGGSKAAKPTIAPVHRATAAPSSNVAKPVQQVTDASTSIATVPLTLELFDRVKDRVLSGDISVRGAAKEINVSKNTLTNRINSEKARRAALVEGATS
ncbi:hypothetical protein [Mycetocola zhadangensis]|nr:hypothetical protein [Mycetocola zhadangensis]